MTAFIDAFKWIIQCGINAPEFPLGTALWCAGIAIGIYKRIK